MSRFKWTLPLVAILLVAAGVFAMNTNQKSPVEKKFADRYYKFNSGADENQAQNISNWTEIDEDEYEASGCESLHRPCMIKSNAALTSVPTLQQTGYKDPVVSGAVTEVKNRSVN